MCLFPFGRWHKEYDLLSSIEGTPGLMCSMPWSPRRGFREMLGSGFSWAGFPVFLLLDSLQGLFFLRRPSY